MKRNFTLIILIHLAGICAAQISTADQELIGKNIFGIQVMNQEGDTVTLEEFRGKYLYIDFWFTQCKPCIAEFPIAKQLKSKMENENIAFINISFDMDPTMWRESIKRFDITGENYRIAGFDSYNFLRNEFNVLFFPKYWVVNPDGNILNPSAGRPSNYIDNDYLINEMDDGH